MARTRRRHLYGRSIHFYYFPLAGDEDTMLDSLVSARLYDEEPTDEQLADDGQLSTGHISRVTEWTPVNDEGTGAAGYRITFPALTDDSPNGEAERDTFFVALNFLAEAGGPELRDSEQIIVWRPDGLTSKADATAEDIYALESSIREVGRGQAWVESKINLAIEDFLSRLKGRGYKKRRLFDLEELSTAVRRRACAYCCMDLFTEADPSWGEKRNFWWKDSEQHFDIAKIGYDADEADRPDPEQSVQTGGVVAPLR